MDKKKIFMVIGIIIVIVLVVYFVRPNPIDKRSDERYVESLDPPEEFVTGPVDRILAICGYYSHDDLDACIYKVVVHFCSGEEWALEGKYTSHEIHHLVDWAFTYAPNIGCP